jgi:hypothetical protein
VVARRPSGDAIEDATGHAYNYNTVRNAAIVSEKFESARRRADVPFYHHAEVAVLPEGDADALLDIVEAEGTKRADLREKVKERKNEISVEHPEQRPHPGGQHALDAVLRRHGQPDRDQPAVRQRASRRHQRAARVPPYLTTTT